MVDRQTRNVSLPPQQDAFLEGMIASGRYRTASEVVRDALRMLEEAEHRRLLEKWLYGKLSPAEEEQLPSALKERAKAHFEKLLARSMDDVREGRVVDGPTALEQLKAKLKRKS